MIHIIVTVFILINGVPSTEPETKFGSKHTFENTEACETFLASETVQAANAAILERLKDDNATATFKCQNMEE